MFHQMSQHHAQQRSSKMSQHPAQKKNMKFHKMSQHPAQHYASRYNGYKEPAKKCSYCRGYGHIRSECFKLYGYPQKVKPPRSNKNPERAVETKGTHN
ncbi:hypothetical protein A2U01_0062395, partial [Trifolium medium]|nr:hypothetical protein [Trifolium medium]